MMCDNQHNFAYPWNNSFYQHYLQQHAILSHHFQKMHNINGTHYSNIYDSVNVCDPVDCSSSCSSSSCSCCSSGSCSKTSSTDYDEVEEMYNEEGEEQYDEEDFEDDESGSEYEFNVDCILAMRAAKEELKKEEPPSESKDGSESRSDSKSDSIVLVESDKDDFEFVDLSSTKMLDFKLSKSVGKFNKTEEEATQKKIREYLYGEKSSTIAGIETAMALNFERLCDNHQPSLWPVLPLCL